MPAKVEQPSWTAYCDDCDWESHEYDYRAAADVAAEQHNNEYHEDEE